MALRARYSGGGCETPLSIDNRRYSRAQSLQVSSRERDSFDAGLLGAHREHYTEVQRSLSSANVGIPGKLWTRVVPDPGATNEVDAGAIRRAAAVMHATEIAAGTRGHVV